jgi:competence protein ComEC
VQQLPALPSLWWGLLLVPFGALVWRHPLWLVPVFFLSGLVWASLRADLILAEQLPIELEGQDLVVEGFVADIPQVAEYGLRFEFDVTEAKRDDASVRIPARILLTARDQDFQPRAGEAWRLTVRLTRPHGFQNPGGFDYEAWLFRERLRARGYVRDAPQRLTVASGRYGVNRLRQDLGERMRARLDGHSTGGIVVALANGDARGISATQWDVFRRTGTLHLVAISGMHITLIAGVAFFLVRWLWSMPGITVLWLPAPVAGAIGALLAAAGYAALAGFVIPTQRALIMLAVAMGAILLRRRIAPSRLLAMAMLCVLVYDPLAAMAAGFWLSFAAVAIIIYVMHADPARPSLWRKWGYLQWAITLGMLPFMLALFQQISLTAPLANLVAVPVFDLMTVPLTLAGIVALGLFPEAVATGCFQSAAWLLEQLWPVLEWLGRLDFAVWTQHQPPAWTLACGLIGVAWLLAPRGWPARWVGSVWLLPLFLLRPPAPAAGELWFTLLDVGQGLSAVVRTSTHTLVFDTGARFSPRFDTGSAVLVPYLRAVGVARVDTLMVSHGDNDHIGGADSLLAALPVARRLSSVPDRLAGAQPCVAGDRWEWDGVTFTVLHPPPGGSGRDNNASCVLYVQGAHGSVLLPGDIEARAERCLVRRYGPKLAADILVAPHHGSKTSSTCDLIAQVQPKHVLFPVGYRNRYHHPYPPVLARYAQTGAQLYDSAASGALDFRLRAGGIEISRYRDTARRYWFSD